MEKLHLLLPIFCSFILSNVGISQPVAVSQNGRYLTEADGNPFFYLGDTAWELFHRLGQDEADHYLENRAAKGFTVIQAVVLAQLGGLTVPNANGDLPLKDQDPAEPEEAYFEHVDYIVEKAESLGLTIGMLPTWGSYWNSISPDENIFNVENARFFGKFLGMRYRSRPIIWILGGDHNIHTENDRSIIEAMAAGLEEGMQGEQLITYHPRGPGASSHYFHAASWMDFNMFQSSHGGFDHDNGLYAEHDLSLSPSKPTLDGEPRYERIPVGFYFRGNSQMVRFDDYDVRQAAYWSILAGACGHTYGHNSVWQMYDHDKNPVIGAITPWHEALDHPGAKHMQHLAGLFKSRPFHTLIPNQNMIVDGPTNGGSKIRAAIAEDNSFALIYSPRGSSFTLDKGVIKSDQIKEIWYDPRYGVSYHLHTGDTPAIQTYTPPTSGRGQDWILILENDHLNLPMPGQN